MKKYIAAGFGVTIGIALANGVVELVNKFFKAMADDAKGGKENEEKTENE